NLARPVRQALDHFRTCQPAALFRFEYIMPIAIKVRGGNIEGQGYIFSGPQAGFFDGPYDIFHRLAIRLQPRTIAPFIADEITFVTVLAEQLSEPAVDPDSPFDA